MRRNYSKNPVKKTGCILPGLAAVAAALALLIIFALGGPAIRRPSVEPLPTTAPLPTRTGPKPTPAPACPAVNRKLPLSPEEAIRLRGTGYLGNDPFSFSEAEALSAAQAACWNCGYHSENGNEALCDYCRWQMIYGGGLPREHAPGWTYPTAQPATARPTPRPTAKPTKRSTDIRVDPEEDPFDAEDYPDPEDFYDEYYDDFWDYEDAEDYWMEYH